MSCINIYDYKLLNKILSFLKKYKYSIYFALPFVGLQTILIIFKLDLENHFRPTIIYWILFLIFSLYLIYCQKIYNNKLNKFQISFLVLFFLYFIRVIFDTFLYPVELGFPIPKYYAYLFGVTLIPTFAFNFSLDEKELKISFLIINIVSTSLVLIAWLFQHYDFVNGFNRLYGGYHLHPIQLGHLCVTNIIISLFFIKEYKKKSVLIVLYLIIIFLSSLVLFSTASRGPLLSLIIVLTIMILSFFSLLKIKNMMIIGSLVILILIIILSFEPGYINRLLFTAEHGDARIFHWKTSLSQFMVSPLFGSSLEENISKIYPHNIWLESFLAVGIFGGMIFSYILYLFLKANKFAYSSKSMIWVAFLFIQYFIASMFSGSLITNYHFWYLGSFIFYFASNNKRKLHNK